jgi:AraC family transcriptional regulator
MKSTPEIVTLPARFFVGLQTRFITPRSPDANNQTLIPKLWSAFVPRLREIAGVEPGVTYGLCACPDSLGLKAEHPDEAVYLAAAEVAGDAPTPPGMVRWSSSPGTYAKFIHRGPVAGIGETMGFIYGEWLPGGDYDRGPGPDIERYDARFDPVGEQSILEIFIPVRVRIAPR